MHTALWKTVWRLDQVFSSYFLEDLVLVADLLELLRAPVLVDINKFKSVQVGGIFLTDSIHLTECPLAQEFEDFKVFDPDGLLWTTGLLWGLVLFLLFALDVEVQVRVITIIKHDHGLDFAFDFRILGFAGWFLFILWLIDMKMDYLTIAQRVLGLQCHNGQIILIKVLITLQIFFLWIIILVFIITLIRIRLLNVGETHLWRTWSVAWRPVLLGQL